MDRGAWWATVHGVTTRIFYQNARTTLSRDLSTPANFVQNNPLDCPGVSAEIDLPELPAPKPLKENCPIATGNDGSWHWVAPT